MVINISIQYDEKEKASIENKIKLIRKQGIIDDI